MSPVFGSVGAITTAGVAVGSAVAGAGSILASIAGEKGKKNIVKRVERASEQKLT